MFIDVGLTSREEVEQAGIQVGDPVTYRPNYHRFGDGMICSKALDDRVGVFVLLGGTEVPQPRNGLLARWYFRSLYWKNSASADRCRQSRPQSPNAIVSLDITIATDTPADKDLCTRW
jgi:putative aminopeptidase